MGKFCSAWIGLLITVVDSFRIYGDFDRSGVTKSGIVGHARALSRTTTRVSTATISEIVVLGLYTFGTDCLCLNQLEYVSFNTQVLSDSYGDLLDSYGVSEPVLVSCQ